MTAPAFVFDLDGTLVDSVYQHVLAWREALEAAGIELAVWRIHRRIGMSGGLLVNALVRETGVGSAPRTSRACRSITPARMPARSPRSARFPEPGSCSHTCRGPVCGGRSRPAAGSRAQGLCWRSWISPPTRS
jgi:hypothetical protein